MNWLTVTEYLFHICTRICPVLFSSSAEETDYHSGIPVVTHAISLKQLTSILFTIVYPSRN